MAKDTPYVDVQNLSKSFGALNLFSHISFSIAEGQKVGLIAKNGMGKSTLLSVLAGKEGHDTGDIVFRRDLTIGFWNSHPTSTRRRVCWMLVSTTMARRRRC